MCSVCFWWASLQLKVTGALGSFGVNALLPVEVERGHVSGFVIILSLLMVVDRVQETLLSYLDVTLRPVQVEYFAYCIF